MSVPYICSYEPAWGKVSEIGAQRLDAEGRERLSRNPVGLKFQEILESRPDEQSITYKQNLMLRLKRFS
jgi:hypothetical protein